MLQVAVLQARVNSGTLSAIPDPVLHTITLARYLLKHTGGRVVFHKVGTRYCPHKLQIVEHTILILITPISKTSPDI